MRKLNEFNKKRKPRRYVGSSSTLTTMNGRTLVMFEWLQRGMAANCLLLLADDKGVAKTSSAKDGIAHCVQLNRKRKKACSSGHGNK